jgi:hypothetical protein
VSSVTPATKMVLPSRIPTCCSFVGDWLGAGVLTSPPVGEDAGENRRA